MEINKKELKKIRIRFRTLASNVMTAYYKEQTNILKEFLNYIKQTPLLYNYIQSLAYDLVGLDELLDRINKSNGTEGLDLGCDSHKRAYLLYRTFEYIVEKDCDTIYFGWYYVESTSNTDMAKAFGDRLIYPFLSEIENYIKDIYTDMGFDNESSYNITINSSGVQVNIAEHGSTFHTEQKNKINTDEVFKAIQQVENIIKNMDDERSKIVLHQNLNNVKKEVQENDPKKTNLLSCLNTMKYIALSIATIPDLTTGIQMIATLLGLSLSI